MSTILLANAYYDFRTGTPWTPYVGGGVGFAVNQLTRNAPRSPTLSAASRQTSGRRRSSSPGAAMVGITYDISSFSSIDFGYRFLYIGGTEVSMKSTVATRPSPSAASVSTRFAPAYGSS